MCGSPDNQPVVHISYINNLEPRLTQEIIITKRVYALQRKSIPGYQYASVTHSLNQITPFPYLDCIVLYLLPVLNRRLPTLSNWKAVREDI